MSQPRFYDAQNFPATGTATLRDDPHHHIHVLRLKVGDTCELFNGDGYAYHAIIKEIQKKETTIEITKRERARNESPVHITLAQGISRGQKMDLVIQKAVELGVVEILPIITERSQVTLSAERAENKIEHWEKVIVSACEQSGRCVLPRIQAPQSLSDLLELKTDALKLMADPRAGLTLKMQAEKLAPDIKHVLVLVGPEGGFSSKEVIAAKNAGFLTILLGHRILRTETAPMVCLSLIQQRWGDF